MIYILILLLVCIGALLFMRQRQRENNIPELIKREPVSHKRITPWEAQDEDESGEAAVGPLPDICKCTVLIVDDQPLIRLMLRELFEQEGVTVVEAANGSSTIEAIRRHNIDHLLLDLKLPDMSGIEVLKEIRSLNETVQVSMMTGFVSPEQLEEAERLGVSTYFMKPFDLGHVKKHVINCLRKAKYKEVGVS